MTDVERSWADKPRTRGFPTTTERTRTTSRVAIVTVASVGALVMTGGVAYAYWKATGSGSGTASTGSASALTVSGGTIAGVYPLQKTTIPITVTNTNTFGVTLSTITLDLVTPTGSGCAAGDITLDPSAANVSGGTYTLTSSNVLTKATGTTPGATFNVPIAIGDLAATCTGASHSFTLKFTANGQSS